MNYQITAELNTTPGATATWSDLGGAFKSVSRSLGETVYTASYLADEGFASSEVTGLNFSVTFTGDYVTDDAVILYIFSPDVLHGTGESRKTQLRITKNGRTVTWNVTMTKITESGGEANSPNSVTLELHGNGKPVVTSGT